MFGRIYDYLLQDNHYASLIGIVVFLFIGFLFSNNKKLIKMRKVFGALAIQFILALIVLKTKFGFFIFDKLAEGLVNVYGFAGKGITFVFGNLASSSETLPWGFVFALQIIPIIIFISALMSLLFHFGIIQFVVKIVAFIFRPILKTSGAETLCAVGNSVLGPTEAPLLIKKYLKEMTHSEILTVMISGMCTVAASVMAVYVAKGASMVHILAAAAMSIPGALLMAKLMMPETEEPKTASSKSVGMTKDTHNMFDAIATGTMDGMKVAAIVVAMLIAFVSLMAVLNSALLFATFGNYDLNGIFALLFSKVAWLIGISGEESGMAGTLIGQKLAINEIVAFSTYAEFTTMSARAKDIMVYALCGFANFSTIGILIGGVGALAPNQRKVLAKLGLKALLGATLVNLLNAAIVGLLI